MDDAIFTERLKEACKQIETLPADRRTALLALMEETRERHAKLKRNFSRLHDVLDDWRLKVRYLTFDLEATRRELEELRRQQEDNHTSD